MQNLKLKGVCAKEIAVQINNGILEKIEFIGGCDGNTTGIERLVEGMKVEDVVKKLAGITCGPRKTSCPDQLAKVLQEIL